MMQRGACRLDRALRPEAHHNRSSKGEEERAGELGGAN
jgi:hypothetical protein